MQKSDLHIARSSSGRAASRRRAVLLFARAPQSEARAKRINGLGFAGRLKLFTSLTRQAVQAAAASGYDLIVATDGAVPIFRNHAAGLLRQRGADFGERLLNATRDAFALGYDDVAVIGNDSPELSGETIRAVLNERPTGSISLCRAADGGVTLIGVGREVADSLQPLFTQPRWETSFLFDDLAEIARSGNIAVDEREGGSDLDSVADLIRLARAVALPRELLELADLLLLPSLRSSQPFSPYIRPLRRTLRACRQKAPPLSLFHPAF